MINKKTSFAHLLNSLLTATECPDQRASTALNDGKSLGRDAYKAKQYIDP